MTFERQKNTGTAGKTPPARRCFSPVLVAFAALSAGGCSRPREAEQAPPPVMMRETAFDGVNSAVKMEPGNVRLDRDNLLTVVVDAPTSVVARLPPIHDRLSGFVLAGAFEREPVETRGRTRREYCFRLSPLPSDEYRIAPMAVSYFAAGAAADRVESWFPTPALELSSEPVAKVETNALQGIFGPEYVPPTPWTVAGYILLVLLAAGVVCGLWRLGKIARRAALARRLSPGERALWELRELLAKNLVRKGRVKDFYVAITMIVRRYIERAHGVRAPRQTTEEFLRAAAENPAFTEKSMAKLGAFLVSADLVKYAAAMPSDAEVNGAVNAAREYIETDSARPSAGAVQGREQPEAET